MSGYALSRFILFAQAEGLALVATTVGLLSLIALATSCFRHYATPESVSVRLWVPMPDDLPDTPSPLRAMYGAPDLKARYRKFMVEGVSGATLLHAAVVILLLIVSSRGPAPVEIGEYTIIRPIPPTLTQDPLHQSTEPEGVLWGKESTGRMPLPMPPTVSVPAPAKDTFENLLRTFNLEDLGPGIPGPVGVGIWDQPKGEPSFGRKTGHAVVPSVDEDVPFFQPVEKMPVLVSMNEPVYPAMARVQALEGDVTVRALVSPEGRVEKVNIMNPIPLLDEAARVAALTALFKPAYWNNKPVRVWVEFTVRFNLR